MCDFFQFIILFTVYDRKSLLGSIILDYYFFLIVLLATAQIPEYFSLTVKEIHTFSNFLHIDQTSYGNIIKHFEREKEYIYLNISISSVQIDSFLQYLCDEIPLGLLDIISLQLQENLLGVNTYNNIKNRQKNIEYIIKFKEQHNNENPSESLGVRIRHYFTGEPSSYQYDYVPTSTDTNTSILQYYRDQYNIPRPKELPPLYHHNNGDKASNKLLSDLSSHSHSHSDYNEDQISLIKRAYGNRTAEIPACFRSSSRSKYSVNASHSERSSEEEEGEDNDNDGMSPLQIQRTSSHNSTIHTSIHQKSKYKNSVEKTCWINVNPVVVKPFGQVSINESDDE